MSQRRNRSTLNATASNEEEVDNNLDEPIKECVRFLLCREGNKVPIKRAEISKHLTTVCQTASNQINTCIIEANKILKRVYGYKLVQVAAKSGIQYIIVSNEECESVPSAASNPQHRKLLVATLLHIFMCGGPVKDDDMWKFLAEAGLMEEEDQATKKILTNTFTRQMYLQYNKVGEGDLARFVFEWGQRAIEEVPKLFLLQKMATAFEKTPDHWCEQYKEATADNEEN